MLNLQIFTKGLSGLWCRWFHRGSISWPVQGQYRCWKCLREYPTKF